MVPILIDNFGQLPWAQKFAMFTTVYLYMENKVYFSRHGKNIKIISLLKKNWIQRPKILKTHIYFMPTCQDSVSNAF